MLKNKTLTVFLAVIIVLMIGFGITAATGGLSFFGIKPNIASSANLIGAWSLAKKDLTEKTIFESDFNSGIGGFSGGRYHTFVGDNDGISDGIVSYDDVLKFTSDDQNALHYLFKSSIVESAKNYTATFKVYIPNANTNLDGFHITGTYYGFSNTDVTCKKISDGSDFGTIDGNSIKSSKGSWAEVSINFNSNLINSSFALYTLGGGSTEYAGANSASDDIIYVKDFVIKELDTSIKDTSGNANDGEIIRTNLAINGDFDTDSDWNKNTPPWTITGGKAIYDGSVNGSTLAQATGHILGHTYRVRFTISDWSGTGNATANVHTNFYYFNANGTYTIELDASIEGGNLFFRGQDTHSFKVDDVIEEDITWEQDQNSVANQAMDFDGVGDYVDTGDIAKFGTSDYSISLWFNENIGETTHNGLISKGTYTTDGGFVVYLYSGDYITWYSDTQYVNTNLSLNGLSDGLWHYLTCVKNGDIHTIYVDGIEISSATLSSVNIDANNNLGFGVRDLPSSPGEYLNGSMSDIAIYDGALTGDQVSQLYKSGRSSGGVKVDARNKVDNGGFDEDSDWTKETGWTISGGEAVASNVTGYDRVSQNLPANTFVVGRTYKVIINVTSLNSGTFGFYLAGSGLSAQAENNINSTGIHTFYKTLDTVISQQTAIRGYSDVDGSIESFEIVDVTNAMTTGSLQKGLILDMPLNESYSEAVDSGKGFDFVDDSWLSGGTGTINNNNTISTTGGYAIAYQNVFFTVDDVGKKMKLLLTFTNDQGENLQIRDSSGVLYVDGVANGALYSPGTHVIDIVVTASGGNFIFGLQGSGSSTYDISVKKIMYLDGITKDRTPYGNDGTVEGASIEYDGLINSGNGIAYTPSNAAYGTWEFDVYKSLEGNYTGASFIDTSSSGRTNGYLLQINSAERVDFRRYTDGSMETYQLLSAESSISLNTWYRLKITRSLAGVFTVYIKGGSFGWDDWTLVSGGSSSNPFTDNTYTTSNYFVAEVDNGDKIRNLKIDGKSVRLSNATQSSGTWTTTGPSYDFDGTNDYISVGDISSIGDIYSGTIRFYTPSVIDKSTAYVPLLNFGTGTDSFLHLGALTGSITDEIIVLGSWGVNCSYWASPTESISAGWHTISWSWDGAKNQLYLDGVAITTETKATPAILSPVNFYIGTFYDEFAYFNGQISNVKMWNRALSTDEINILYNRER
jgi:concanavalin A-like lectin/glucanase superfamily protein